MKKLILWIPAILLCTYIFYWSSVPGVEINERGLGNENLHRVGHFLLFFSLCGAFYLPTRNWLVSVMLTVIYALTDELHQSFVPLRSASLFDIYVDTLGALSAVTIWNIYLKIFKQPKKLLKN